MSVGVAEGSTSVDEGGVNVGEIDNCIAMGAEDVEVGKISREVGVDRV